MLICYRTKQLPKGQCFTKTNYSRVITSNVLLSSLPQHGVNISIPGTEIAF